MLYFVFSICAYLLARIILPLVIKLTTRHHVFDRNNSLNAERISRLGGIGVFFSFIIPVIVLITILGEFYVYVFLIPLVLIFLLGLYDDLFNINAFMKLFIQVTIALLAVLYGDIVLTTNIFASSYWNALIGNALSVFIIVYVINAFNLIDGIDGLASLLGILAVFFIAISLFIYGERLYAAFSFIFCSSLLAFLRFNFSPARIYLGDSGSMLIGLIAVMLAFKLLAVDREIAENELNIKVFLLSIFIVPLYDTFRVFVIRVLRRKSPFKRDENHIHHRLRMLGWNDTYICLAITLYTLLMVLLTFAFQGLGEALQIFFLFSTAMLTNRLLAYRLQHEIIAVRINRNI